MAKHTGITIRIGAMHDSVQAAEFLFDRADMRKSGNHKQQGELRRGVVEAWNAERNAGKAKAKARSKRRQAARSAKRERRSEQTD